MMAYSLNLLRMKIGEVAVHLPHQHFRREHLLVEPGGIWIKGIKLLERRIIETVGDFVHIFDAETRLAKTKLNRIDREIAGVFFAAEAFLRRGGDKLPVNYQNRSGIVTLRDAV